MKLFYGYGLIAVGFFFYALALFALVQPLEFSLEGLWRVITDGTLRQSLIQSFTIFGLGIPLHLIGRRMVSQSQKHF
jgi:hypothetical protein